MKLKIKNITQNFKSINMKTANLQPSSILTFFLFNLCVIFGTVNVHAQSNRVQATTQTTSAANQGYLDVLKKSLNTISFEENKGQWEPNVLMQGHTNVGEMVVKKDHLYFFSYLKNEHEGEEEEEEEDENYTYQVHGWGIFMDGHNPNYTVEKRNEFLTKYNYFIGPDASHHASDVSAYGEVDLKEIYNGIDLRMYSQDNKLMEFDWVVKPGANFRDIKMRFKGQDKLRIDEKGNLSVKIRFNEVKFDIPESYQLINGKKVPVQMSFALDGDAAIFKAEGPIDERYPLIIDPSLKWGTWVDGGTDNFDEYLFAVDVDAAGNVYCGGAANVQFTRSYIGAAIFGYDSTYNDAGTGGNGSNRDGIVYELSTDGTKMLRLTYFGSVNPDAIYGLSLSPDNSRLFVCGATRGAITTTASPATPAFDNTRGGTGTGSQQDGFVAVFNSNLNTLLYSSYMGGDGTVAGSIMDQNNNGDRMVTIRATSNTDYVVGGRFNGNFTGSPSYVVNAPDGSYDAGMDMYIARFTNLNTLAMGTFVGGNADDNLNDLNVFSDGAIAFVGYTSSTVASFPGLINPAGAYPSGSASQDAVVGVIPAAGGSFSMLSRIGGSSSTDQFNGLTIGANDTIYVTGYTRSDNFPLGSDSLSRFRSTKNSGTGNDDGIIGKLPRTGRTGAGNPWKATYFSGTGNDRGNTIRLYGQESAVMVFGETGSQPKTAGNPNGFPVKNLDLAGNSFYDSTYNGGTWDIFWIALETNLSNGLFCTYVGGSDNDYLGETGTPAGSNHFVVEGDTLIVLGTTVHSTSLQPAVIGPLSGPNQVFDINNSTNGDDIHLVFKWRIGAIFTYDQGDAPTSYGTGRHNIVGNLRIGALEDAEDFYPVSPGTRANVDDQSDLDDEDGIPGSQILIQDTGTSYSVTIPITNTTGSTAIVAAWLDLNRNGVFDAGEVDTVRVANGAISATLSWNGFNWTSGSIDTSYLRIRISTDPLMNVANPPNNVNYINGEVEDYLVIRYHCVNLNNASVAFQNPSTCSGSDGSITLSNTTLLPNTPYQVKYRRGVTPVGPLSVTTNGVGNLVIPNLIAGSYDSIWVFHATNPGCGDTIKGPFVLVDPPSPPKPTISVLPNDTLCAGQNMQLTANGQVGSTFNWTGPGGFTANNTAVVNRNNITVGMGGLYSLTEITLAGCTATVATINITIIATPNAPTGVTVSPSPVCSGNSITLSATGQVGATFTWTTPDGPILNGSPVNRNNVTLAMAGVYSVTQTVNGCSSPSANSASLVVNATPAAPTSLNASSNPICTGNSVTITASGQVGAAFTWTTPDGLNPTNNPLTRNNVTLAMGGNYTVTQTVLGCPSASSAALNLVVTSTPSAPTGVTVSPSPVCVGADITLSATGIGGAAFTWTTPDGPTLSGNPVTRNNVTLAMAGVYSVTQTVTGCTSPSANSASLVVNANPLAPTGVTVSPTPVCTGDSITLSATGQGGASFTWTTPDGPILNGKVVGRNNVTLAMAGVYSVTQTVTGCTSPSANSASLVVNTTPAPPTSLDALPNPICTGNDVTLTASGQGGATFTWTTPDGLNPTGNPLTRNSVTLAMGGNYTVIQTVLGCNSAPSAALNLVVTPTPLAPTGVTVSPNPICTGNDITLSAIGQGGATFTWTTPDGATLNGNPVTRNNVTLAMAGIYSVTQTVTGCTSPSANSASLVVNATPTAPTNVAANPNPLCAGQTLTLSADGDVGNTFNWGGPNAFTQSGNPINRNNVNASMAGNYTVTQSSPAGCTSAASLSVNVVVNPLPSVTAGSSSASYCAGTTILLTSTPSGGTPGYTYVWSGPQSFSNLTQNPSISNATTLMSGIYQVALTDNNGCTASASTNFITVQPALSVTAGSNSPVCAGGTINLNSSPGGGTPTYTFTWSGPSFASGLQNPDITSADLSKAGTYNVTITDAFGCSGTATTSVTVNTGVTANAGMDKTIPSCSVSGAVLGGSPTATGGTSPYSYAWSPPSGLTSDTTANPSVAGIGSPTNYTVTVTDANGCSASDIVFVDVTGSSLQVTIAPNTPLFWCEGTGV
ncbi:MAG: hypothetical protein IPP77_00170 [Bacteroidetes bacterium]|nr:hypothetical protein [Bacteroidota bacterium]